MGKSVLTRDIEINSGYNNLRLETSAIRPGLYMLKFRSDSIEQIRKISILK